ncbi:MAG TPA: polymer-forming cytoskeletal protein [Burkholderiales bacterium]|nr:polymer-forming cytoskeletal protein [Burkholderiales bacterium]
MPLLLVSVAVAAAGDRPGVHEAVIAGDYFGAGSSASPAATVEGDAFIAGADMDIDKPVTGDAVLGGARVSVSAHVGGSVYATGGSIAIDAPVGGNVRVAGGQVELGKRAQVAGRTTLAGGRVTVLGRVGRQLVVFAEHVVLDGEIAGNATIAARSLTIGPNARVSGKLTYRGSQPAQVDAAAVLTGGINYLTFDFEDETYQPVARVLAWAGAIAFTVGLFLIGMIAILVAPEATAHISLLGRRRPVSSLLLGLVTIACVPVAVVLLMVTIVGIPFAFMLLLAWPMMLIFGYLAGIMAVSDAIAGPNAEARGRRIFLLAMGLGVMLLFARVPVAGWCIGMLLLVMGVGATMLSAMGASVPMRVKKPPRHVEAAPQVEPAMRREPTFRID